MKIARTLVALSLVASGALAASASPPDSGAVEPIELSLADALSRGLEQNLAALVASGRVEQAEGERQRALARLLPEIHGSLGESRQKINLEAYGFPPPPGESPLVGPFDVYDLRLHVSQNVLDATALARARAARRLAEASRSSYQQARESVVASVAELYLAALASEARIAAAGSQVTTAEAAATLARHRKEVGRAAGIDVLRAEVALGAERQRLIQAENESAKLELSLAQAIGLSLDRPLRLTDRIDFAPLEEIDPATAIERARAARPDLIAARLAVAAAEASLDAARRERLPTIAVQADFGPIGPTPDSAEDTYSVAGTLRLPLFEGGRIAGEVQAANGRLTAARARLADLDRRVELDVRSSRLDVAAAARLVEVARQQRDLAGQQLIQAQDRFAAGVADNLEVVQAQENVATGNARYVDGLFAYNRSKVALALALGVAEGSTARFLRGEIP